MHGDPLNRFEAGQGFGHRRHVGQRGVTARRGDGDATQFASHDMRMHRTGGGKHQRHLPAQQIGHRRPRAFVGNVLHIHAGLRLEHLGGKMPAGAYGGRCEIDFARLCFGHRDQFFDAAHRQRRMHHNQIRLRGEQRHRLEIADRVVRHFGLEIGYDGKGGLTGDEQVVAIGGRTRGELGADDSAGAGTVIDEKGLPQAAREFVGHRAADDVIAATRRIGNDHAHGFCGVIELRSGRQRAK